MAEEIQRQTDIECSDVNPTPLLDLLGEDYDFSQSKVASNQDQPNDLDLQTEHNESSINTNKLREDQINNESLTDIWKKPEEGESEFQIDTYGKLYQTIPQVKR